MEAQELQGLQGLAMVWAPAPKHRSARLWQRRSLLCPATATATAMEATQARQRVRQRCLAAATLTHPVAHMHTHTLGLILCRRLLQALDEAVHPAAQVQRGLFRRSRAC